MLIRQIFCLINYFFYNICKLNSFVLAIINFIMKSKSKLEKEGRVIEQWVEVKIWNPEHVYNVNGINYIPLLYIEEFTDYSRSRVRWLIHEWRVDRRAYMHLGNMILIRRDYVPALQMMFTSPDKYSRSKYMIDIYYKKVDIK